MGPHHRSSRCGDRPARGERRCGVGAVSVVTAAVFAGGATGASLVLLLLLSMFVLLLLLVFAAIGVVASRVAVFGAAVSAAIASLIGSQSLLLCHRWFKHIL